jgi:hypothetical protein
MARSRCYLTEIMKHPQFWPLVATTSQRPGFGTVIPDGKKYSRSGSGTGGSPGLTGQATVAVVKRRVSAIESRLRPRTNSGGMFSEWCSGAHQTLPGRPAAIARLPPRAPPMMNSPERTGPTSVPSMQRRSGVPGWFTANIPRACCGTGKRGKAAASASAFPMISASVEPVGIANVCPSTPSVRRIALPTNGIKKMVTTARSSRISAPGLAGFM